MGKIKLNFFYTILIKIYLIEFMLTFILKRNLALRISDAEKCALTQSRK